MKNNKMLIFGILILLVVSICSFSIYILNKNNNDKDNIKKEYVRKLKYNGLDYYVIQNEYDKDYDLQKLNLDDDYEEFNTYEIMNFKEYSTFCKKWNVIRKYKDVNKKYMVISYANNNTNIIDVKLAGIEYINRELNVYVWDNVETGDSNGAYSIIFPIEKEIDEFNVIRAISKEEFTNLN